MDTEERMTELEIQSAHQDDAIASLNDVIISQQKRIDDLEARLLKIESDIKSGVYASGKDASEEPPPPHY